MAYLKLDWAGVDRRMASDEAGLFSLPEVASTPAAGFTATLFQDLAGASTS